MKTIQINNIANTFDKAVWNDIHHLRKHLDNTFENSDRALLENVFSETRLLLNRALDDLQTESYYEKCIIFSKISDVWFEFWQHYKDNPQAVNFVCYVDDITNRAITYMHLCRSISLINENHTNEYKVDFGTDYKRVFSPLRDY